MFFKNILDVPNKRYPVKEQSFAFQNIEQIVLHIDVNGTIIAEDKAGGETPVEFIEKLVNKAKAQRRTVNEEVLKVIAQKLATREEDAAVFIFPSLFRLLDHLDAQQLPYRIIFRTFGSDIPDITKEIQKKRPEVVFKHIEFKKQNCNAQTQRQMFLTENIDDKWVTVQENYEHWDTHGREAQAGKQMCLNQNPRILDVFFDDCIRRKDLIHVIASDGVTMEKTEAIARGHLVDVDTLEAMYDDDYFIKKLMKASASYSDSWQLEPLSLLKLNM